MQIHYLDNSGFALIDEKEMLLFDCYNPKAHPLLGADALSKMNRITIFASHAHGDHYSSDIFSIPNAQFVLGFDIPAHEGAVSMKPQDTADVNDASITAYGSTDEGVSFYVEWKGHRLFHAGDLNDWHWRDEEGEDFAKNAEADFLRELNILRGGVSQIDIAFFPVDPRMGTDYCRGALLFAQAMCPKRMIPMHFQNRYAPPQAFLDEMKSYTDLLSIPSDGVIEL